MSDPLTTILNQCSALIDSGFVTQAECAHDIGESQQRISEWVTRRAHEPSGKVAFKLQDWCARKTKQMAMAGNDQQAAYRSSYRRISKEFAVGGRD